MTDALVQQTLKSLKKNNFNAFFAETPCAKTGKCTDCESPARICNVWSITVKRWPPGRISVVLIQGDFGL